MAETAYLILALLPLLAWYLYVRLRQWRFKKYAHIPNYFPQHLLLGHLKLIAEGYKKLGGDSRRHIDYILEDMLNSVGRPEIFFMDLRPANYGMVLISSHEIAEQISRSTKALPWSVGKSPTLRNGFRRLIGDKSLLSEETNTFMSKLDVLAATGEDFNMDPLCTDLTFDIIGEVVFNIDFKAQGPDSEAIDIVKHFRTLIQTYTDTGRFYNWLNVPKRITRVVSSYQTDAAIKKCIREKFAEANSGQSTATKQNKDRSVLALSLQDSDHLTSELLQSIADQVKSFLFAGHDTTSILLQRLFYALSIHPKCLATIRAEHDAVFGNKDPQDVFLARPDECMKSLTYTSACIKEALRLWPPAGSARMAQPGTGFKVRLQDGREVLLDGTVLYVDHYIIQRDPKVYGETANDFVPERWLGDTDTSSARKDEAGSQIGESKIPISAWRAFERGPRNCIGQELANLEARVILACVMRRYDFTKVGAGEVERDEKGQPVLDEKTGAYKTQTELFNSMIVTSKPFDKCRMRIKRHGT